MSPQGLAALLDEILGLPRLQRSSGFFPETNQITDDVRDLLIPSRRVLIQAAPADWAYTQEPGCFAVRDWSRSIPQDRGNDFGSTLAREVMAAQAHLMKDDAQAKNVRTMVNRFPLRLLGREIGDGA